MTGAGDVLVTTNKVINEFKAKGDRYSMQVFEGKNEQ